MGKKRRKDEKKGEKWWHRRGCETEYEIHLIII